MKKLVLSLLVLAGIASIGCTTTLSVGPKANEGDGWADTSVKKDSISLTIPFVSAELKAD